MTFTFDPPTVARINRIAARQSKAKSEVVRDAIREYDARTGRLSEVERIRMLRIIDEIATRPPSRGQPAVGREIAAIRRARHSGGRLHRAD